MNCLFCGKPAKENGEYSHGLAIRECEDRHRTALAPAGMFADLQPEPFIGWEWTEPAKPKKAA